MSELERIQTTLDQAIRRRRWQCAWNGMWWGLLGGAAIWLLALSIFKLAPIPQEVLIGAAAAGGLFVGAGFLHGWLRKPKRDQMARWVDTKEHLQERLSTALELANTGKDENWRALILQDAARFAAGIDPRKLMPFHLPKVSRWALLALALGAGLGFVPEYRSKAYLEKKQDAETIKAAGKKLVEVTKQSLERRPPALEPTRKALESVEKLGLELGKNPITRTEALKNLANAADQLKSQMKEFGSKNPAVKSLERAARENARSGSTSPELQKKIEALQQALGKGASPGALDKFKNDLQQARQAAADLPSNTSAGAAEARKQLAQKLAELSREAKELGQNMPSLDEAIAALEASQTDNLVRDLDAATTDLDKMREMAKTLEQLQQQASKQGKDLPEQLKFGQIEAAQQSLQKMMNQLKNPNTAPEEMNRMLDELARSVDPASPFGKAAEHLKKAMSQARQGDKAGGAQSLAEASKELQKAQGEMQDMQAMLGSLEALEKAERAIATRQQWGQCAYCKKVGNCQCRRPGMGKGRGGNGVGTWTDDDSRLYPEMSELWDNSQIQRPDQDPRGLTDRGTPGLSPNLSPEKVRGQISPGGQMPSINLKGVSIKGQSSVGYQEAVNAAQSDAQSALNQDQVPRAYQGAVRDYFDDLKK